MKKSLKNGFVFAVLSMLFLPASLVFAKDNAGAFRLILLPDTQHYAALKNPDIFHSQTQWVVDKPEGVAFVLQQGDITNSNLDEQWEVAKAAMERLDGKVPYMFAFGNHDYEKNCSTRETNGHRYFPFEKFAKRADFGGTFEKGRIDNIWQTFKAGGINWLVMSLEFGPRNIVLDWANKVVAAHPNHKVIVNTHAYMYSDDTRMGEEDKWLPQISYGVGKGTGDDAVNDGEAMWEKFVSLHPNMFIVVSGHVINDGTGRLVSKGKNGNKVYQMLANYQSGIVNPETGGDGYLRVLTLDPAARTIDVKTYSPHLDRFKTEEDQQFRFDDVAF